MTWFPSKENYEHFLSMIMEKNNDLGRHLLITISIIIGTNKSLLFIKYVSMGNDYWNSHKKVVASSDFKKIIKTPHVME